VIYIATSLATFRYSSFYVLSYIYIKWLDKIINLIQIYLQDIRLSIRNIVFRIISFLHLWTIGYCFTILEILIENNKNLDVIISYSPIILYGQSTPFEVTIITTV